MHLGLPRDVCYLQLPLLQHPGRFWHADERGYILGESFWVAGWEKAEAVVSFCGVDQHSLISTSAQQVFFKLWGSSAFWMCGIFSFVVAVLPDYLVGYVAASADFTRGCAATAADHYTHVASCYPQVVATLLPPNHGAQIASHGVARCHGAARYFLVWALCPSVRSAQPRRAVCWGLCSPPPPLHARSWPAPFAF